MSANNLYNGTTPEIDKHAIIEIMGMPMESLGGGVIRFPNAVQIDREKITAWCDKNAKKAHEQRWTYHKDDSGVTYATNEDGNKFSLEQIEEVPVRLLNPVEEHTEPEFVEIFRYWEDQIYKCLIRYIDEYPMVLGTIWWRSRGHLLRYDAGDYLGIHNDNDSNFRSTKGKRYIPKGQAQMRQTVAVMLYMNDCVNSEEEYDGTNYVGGNLFFPYLGVETTPKMGDIFIFPTNYIATHGVKTVEKGHRYGYLEFFSQGSSDESVLISVAEADECDGWCRPHWIDALYDDYHKYCLHSEYLTPDKIDRANPVYQNRTLEGDDGLRQPYSHHKVFEDNKDRGKINPDVLMPNIQKN
jgi:hypothetical protein